MLSVKSKTHFRGLPQIAAFTPIIYEHLLPFLPVVSLHKSEDADKAKEWSKRKCSMYGNKKGRRMAECGNSSHSDFDKRPKL